MYHVIFQISISAWSPRGRNLGCVIWYMRGQNNRNTSVYQLYIQVIISYYQYNRSVQRHKYKRSLVFFVSDVRWLIIFELWEVGPTEPETWWRQLGLWTCDLTIFWQFRWNHWSVNRDNNLLLPPSTVDILLLTEFYLLKTFCQVETSWVE